MNRCIGNAKITVPALLGVLLVEVVAFADFAPWVVDPNGMIRLDPNGPVVNWPDRFTEEKYRRDGAEIVPWTQDTGLPSPDNAALLYYQAFLLRPEPDNATYLRINRVLAGGLPDSSIRAYLGLCRETIHTAEVASLVPQCTWGIRFLDRSGPGQTPLLGEMRQVALILETDARTLGIDGHYDAAFARCLTLRRMGRHIGDKTIYMLLTSWAFDGAAQRAIQYLLGVMPPDADALQRLRSRLAATPGAGQSIEKTMQSDLEFLIASMRTSPDLLDQIRQHLAKNASDDAARRRALALTDDEVLTHARELYSQFLDRIFEILDSDRSYEQKYAEIDAQMHEFAIQSAGYPAAGRIGYLWAVNLPQVYSIFVHSMAGNRALKTAIGVYLAYAELGQLPEALPAYSSKDPFSGQDFEYEVTATGFLLRCRAKDLYYNRVWQYEFTVGE